MRAVTDPPPISDSAQPAEGIEPQPQALPRRFKRNVITTYLSTAVSAAQLLLITPLLVRGLGADRYGVWALIGSIGLFANLFDLGLGAATIRFVAQSEGVGDRAATVRTISATFWMLIAFGGAVFAAGAALSPAFPKLFSTHGQDAAASLLLLIIAVDVGLSIVGGTFQGVLGGLQRYSFLNIVLIAVVAGQGLAFGITIWLGGKLVALGLVVLGIGILEFTARAIATRRYVPETTFSPRVVERTEVRRLLGMSFWIGSSTFASAIRFRIDTIVVGALLGVRAAGIYAVGQFLSIAADRFIQPVLTGFFPHSAELAGRNERANLRAAMLTGSRISVGVGAPICLTIILLAEPALHAWVGAGFSDAKLVVVYLVSALLLGTLSRAGLLMLSGTGDYRLVTVLVWSEAVLNIGLSIILGKAIGLTGVALATLISTAIVSTTIGVPLICRSFGVHLGRFLIPIARAHIPAVIGAVLVSRLIAPTRTEEITGVVGAGLGIGITYLIIFALTGLTGDERKRLWQRVRTLAPA